MTFKGLIEVLMRTDLYIRLQLNLINAHNEAYYSVQLNSPVRNSLVGCCSCVRLADLSSVHTERAFTQLTSSLYHGVSPHRA